MNILNEATGASYVAPTDHPTVRMVRAPDRLPEEFDWIEIFHERARTGPAIIRAMYAGHLGRYGYQPLCVEWCDALSDRALSLIEREISRISVALGHELNAISDLASVPNARDGIVRSWIEARDNLDAALRCLRHRHLGDTQRWQLSGLDNIARVNKSLLAARPEISPQLLSALKENPKTWWADLFDGDR